MSCPGIMRGDGKTAARSVIWSLAPRGQNIMVLAAATPWLPCPLQTGSLSRVGHGPVRHFLWRTTLRNAVPSKASMRLAGWWRSCNGNPR
jgi:hypothetical protein